MIHNTIIKIDISNLNEHISDGKLLSFDRHSFVIENDLNNFRD